ncbi:hypothetical protein K456DRAFT_1545443 [Colletotrichum gloeosporioides 23]|nr:hypothetical protein K456DRAFT_1545443 [Colletotrichum gloeosporioides 23]
MLTCDVLNSDRMPPPPPPPPPPLFFFFFSFLFLFLLGLFLRMGLEERQASQIVHSQTVNPKLRAARLHAAFTCALLCTRDDGNLWMTFNRQGSLFVSTCQFNSPWQQNRYHTLLATASNVRTSTQGTCYSASFGLRKQAALPGVPKVNDSRFRRVNG